MKIKITLLGAWMLTSIQHLQAQQLDQLDKQKPFAISGNLDIRGIFYQANGIPNRRSPFSYVLTGSPTVSIYGMAIPVSFTFSEQDRSFRQPFNQFGMSPSYKWITAHAGYRNIQFSPYTLGGHTLLGGGVELNPGKFRIGFVRGRLSKAMEVDSVSGQALPLNFNRYGTAFKLGYGTEKNHFDMSVLKAKDSQQGFRGNLETNTLRPAENLVIGSAWRLELFKKLIIQADGGYSLYTRDYTSDAVLDLDSSLAILSSLQKIMTLNASTERYGAYSASATYQDKAFSLKLGYQYVDPNFQTMGAYFFQNDIRNLTFSPSFTLLKGKLRWQGSLGIQTDNNKNQKQASTRRIIGMTHFSWDVNSVFGIDANYTNFSSNSTPTVQQVQNRYLLAQTTGNLSITPRLILANEKSAQTWILSLNQTSLVDAIEATQTLNQINSMVALLSHTYSHHASGWNFNAGLNYIQNRVVELSIQNYGGSFGASKSILDNKLLLSTNQSYLLNSSNQGKGAVLNMSFQGSFQLTTAHRFTFRLVHLNNRLNSEINPIRFKENSGELAYTFNF